MAQAITFPKEFEHQFFRDLDKGFFAMWFVIFMLLNGLTIHMTNQPLRQLMSAEELKKYTEVIYRVKAEAPKKVVVKEEKTAAIESAAAEEVVEEVVEEKPVTEEKKKEIVAEKRQERRERQEKRRQAIMSKVAILAGPTAKGGGSRRRGGEAAAAAIGLSAGKISGVDVGKMVGIVGDKALAEKVKKIRGGGAISGDIGDIDIGELETMSAEELGLMLSEAPLELPKSAITAKGKGSKSKKRNQSAISSIVMQNKNQVQYCYWTYKRRDSSLKGRVEVEFTIAPSGEVIRVRFGKSSSWGGNSLGTEVQQCIENVIKSWHFDSISESEGNVKAGGITYIFGS